MIACNFKVKEFNSLSGLNNFMRYVMCAIDRYHELESEGSDHE